MRRDKVAKETKRFRWNKYTKGINEIKKQLLMLIKVCNFRARYWEIERMQEEFRREWINDEDNAKNNIKIVQDLVSKNEIKTTYNDATNSLKLQQLW
jgi:hypothetical protein